MYIYIYIFISQLATNYNMLEVCNSITDIIICTGKNWSFHTFNARVNSKQCTYSTYRVLTYIINSLTCVTTYKIENRSTHDIKDCR